eukprot:CAMPEP_0113620232 /NCGR_PEP_ID=MMETSP0017_2-20120614/10302_1 /TAXON_ID=2856 /ORGANISM="Cylindrotheca closterium" /LENGTH=49 /DNA_ID=CAMNT_0000529877 /DNA_START=9 /DNA_END=154 /DNA_ORIENTATION=- /assembly_acc=CAM_ASM_000147
MVSQLVFSGAAAVVGAGAKVGWSSSTGGCRSNRSLELTNKHGFPVGLFR